MEKLLNPYDKQCMKMAMLKHEETFREQVYELHRLYQIQKILMKNIASNKHKEQEQTRSNIKNISTLNQINFSDHLNTSRKTLQGLDLEKPAEGYYNAETDDDGDGIEEIMVEKSDHQLELTLGPSSYYKKRKEADLSLPSESGLSFSSSSTGSSHIKRTSFNSHQKIMNTKDQENSQKWRLDMPISNPSSNVEEHLRQDRLKNPPWLFQVFSLNVT